MEEKCMENWKVNRTETEIIGKMKIVSENQKKYSKCCMLGGKHIFCYSWDVGKNPR